MKPNNPFLISGYYSPEFFCDREQETGTILDALHNGRNVTLIAPRRMGKTGLVRHAFYRFVLVRLLQAMGAFGLRGLYERKPHFIDSIQPGLHSIDRLFQSGRLGADYAEIRRVCRQLLE